MVSTDLTKFGKKMMLENISTPLSPIRALVIASPHIDRILSGEKTWEMRSTNCRFRELVGLIKKGSGHVVGVAEIIGTKGPLSPDELRASHDNHRIALAQLEDPRIAKWNIAWMLDKVRPLNAPVPYRHPNGAQSWVRLDAEVRSQIYSELRKV